MKINVIVTAIIGAIIFITGTVNAADNDKAEWYWLASDNKYSKFFNPSTVTVTKKAKTESGKDVPTEIEAWTKTVYTYEGAAKTIKEYGITKSLPDARTLTYSLALLNINPQTRTIQYAREDFYNSENTVIWSTSEGRVKEINSQSFDEDFYAAIVDEVFKHGEVDRKNAKDRWIDLWKYTNDKGETTNCIADTTTMQLKGTNLILWEWEETKNSDGKVLSIRFMKKAVNLPQGTERIATGSLWTPAKKWTELDDEYDGAYRAIKNDDPDYKGLIRLRAYAKGYSTWVTRYSITGNVPVTRQTTDKEPEEVAPSVGSQEKTFE